MKASIAFAVAIGAAMAAAQSPSDLPGCGQVCINNMISIAQNQFKCKPGDIQCYCNNVNFGYGVRDCSNESCNQADAARVIQYGTNYCQNALGGSNKPSNGASATGSAAATGSGAPNSNSNSNSTASATASSTPVTTTPLLATVTSGTQVITETTGFATVFSAVPATGSAGASASNAASSARNSANSAASSATSAGLGAPLQTAGPMLGLAGIAALLVI